MSQLLAPPPVPFHESLLEGISIAMELFTKNISPTGRDDQALEDWVWEIIVTNNTNPFCSVKGSWGAHAVRSLQPIDLDFNTHENYIVMQFQPDDIPQKFTVEEVSNGKDVGICLVAYFKRPGAGLLRLYRGLYSYHCA